MTRAEARSERELQRVEHCGLVYTVTVTLLARSAYTFINGERHKVYPTGNDNEPWTTNIRLMR